MDKQISNEYPHPDVLMLALARHDSPYSSTAWSLAKAFSGQSRVFFVDNPFTITDFFKKSKRAQIRKRYSLAFVRKTEVLQVGSIIVVVPPLTIPVNWLPEGMLYTLFSRFNNWLLYRAINSVLKKFELRNYLYINSFNPFYGADAAFSNPPAFYIYQTVDDISQSKYVARHGPRLEKRTMREADAVAATSECLTKKAFEIAPLAVCIPNAADIHLFNKAGRGEWTVPDELKGEERKVICYTGSIDHRLDYQLLKEVAERHKDKLLLMVGPQMSPDCKDSGFADLPNVRLTGKKPLEELPAYLQYAHCAIIPFKCNELTASIYPLKINEYLAAGKGVVTTPFSEDIRTFGEVVALESTSVGFSEAIDAVLDSDSEMEKEKRIAKSAKNNWKSRAYDFYALALKEMKLRNNPVQYFNYEERVG